MNTMRLNFEKMKALVHYVCNKATNPADLGAVKLNKVLWYADSTFYMVKGESITGETYVKRQHGPVPKHILTIVDSLVEDHKIARGKVDHFGFMKNEYISLDDPDISGFSALEISFIDQAFEHVCMRHTARSVSAETHGVIWELAQMGEEIPLYTAFASAVGEIDEDDIAWGRQRFGLAA